MKHLIGIFLLPLIIFFNPVKALALAGFAESSNLEAGVFLGAMLLGLCLVPYGAFNTYKCGLFAWFQLPIILAPLTLAIFLLRRAHSRERYYWIILPILYVSLTFITNIAGMTIFRVDHSKDLPIENVFFSRLKDPQDMAKLTEDNVIKMFGEPYAKGQFRSSSSILPVEVLTQMTIHKVGDGCTVFAYYEKAPGPHKPIEHMHYFIFDPARRRYVAGLTLSSREQIINKWPYKKAKTDAN